MKRNLFIILTFYYSLFQLSANEPFKTQKHQFEGSIKPIVFTTELPEGQYKVTLTLGGNPEGTSTTLKAESRRLMFENMKTIPGKTLKKVVMVDVRSPRINDSISIKLKPRELSYVNWDNKLSLEITGEKPCVRSLEIRKADNLPIIFLAGNSTVTDQENEPWASWGQMLPNFLTPNIVVSNYAESGETMLAFKREKRLEKIMLRMKKGDYLFLEFAHNDQKPGGNFLDPFTTYKAELKYFISEARKKGGIPVLVTSTARRRFDEQGLIVNTLGDYPAAMKQLAEEEKIMLIDLNALSMKMYQAIGVEESKKLFVHFPANSFPGQTKDLADNTHFSPFGAYELAKCVVQSIINSNYSLKKFIRKDWKTFDPNNPDKPSEFHWYESPTSNVIKPDGN